MRTQATVDNWINRAADSIDTMAQAEVVGLSQKETWCFFVELRAGSLAGWNHTLNLDWAYVQPSFN